MNKEIKSSKGIPKTIKIAIAGVAIGTATYTLAGNIFYWMNLSRTGLESNLRKKFVKNDSKKKEEAPVFYSGQKWFYDTPSVKETITSLRGERLHSDIFTATDISDVWVICVHGYTSSPYNMGMYAKEFCDMGFNVLLPSLHGHADSEVKGITMGWDDRLDIVDWINHIVSNLPNAKIILHGVSMGAAAVMMTLGEELPENVKVAIADCGYTSVWDIFNYQIKEATYIHNLPLLYSANTATRINAKYKFKEASSVNQLKKSKTPTLFMHGEKDTFVPFSMMQTVYDAAASEKEMFSIPDAIHARSCCINPTLYWSKIKMFIEGYI